MQHGYKDCCAMSMGITQCPGVLCNVRDKDWPLWNQFWNQVWQYAMSEVNVYTHEMNLDATILDKDKFWIRCWIWDLNGNGNKKETTKHVQTLKRSPNGRGLIVVCGFATRGQLCTLQKNIYVYEVDKADVMQYYTFIELVANFSNNWTYSAQQK